MPPAPRSPTPSEREIEQEILGSGEVEDDPDKFDRNFWANKAIWDGGVINLSSLLAKAIPPMASATTDPKTWGYKVSSRYFSRSFFARFLNLVTHTLVHLFHFTPAIFAFHLVFMLSTCYSTNDSHKLL